jgi:hypothetical protein
MKFILLLAILQTAGYIETEPLVRRVPFFGSMTLQAKEKVFCKRMVIYENICCYDCPQ